VAVATRRFPVSGSVARLWRSSQLPGERDGEKERGDDAHDRLLGVDRSKFADLDAALEQTAQQTLAAFDHLIEIEAREIGKIAGFGQHQLGNGADARAHDPRKQSGQLF